MPEPLRPMSVPRRTDEQADRLDSWKEIAAYGQEERSALWVYLPLLKPSLAFDAEAEAQLAKYH